MIRLENISDFGPSQDCAIVITEPSGKIKSTDDDALAGGMSDSVNISLKSCLACSGCVTSAEVVLLSSQSLQTMFSLSRPIAFSISPEARASLAGYWDTSAMDAMRYISGILKTLFPSCMVFDMATAVDICLLATEQELNHRIHKEAHRLPLIVSACSGFVCYAEKLHPHILQFLSNVPSPQFVQGKLISDRFPGFAHVVISPCHDRKLEALRDELNYRDTDDLSKNGVDVVITADELLSLTTKNEIEGVTAFNGPVTPSPMDFDLLFDDEFESELPSRHLPAGGYCDHMYLSKMISSPSWSVPKRRGGTRYCTASKDVLLAEVFGFREVQNLLRSIKKGKSLVTMAEVFACPTSACLNGGGLVGSSGGFGDVDSLPKTLNALTTLQHHEAGNNPIAERLVRDCDWGLASFSVKDKPVNPARIDW
ncbi:hypothetical protein GEMRC1_007403 [Eukaryota sp. GEM-RC1]